MIITNKRHRIAAKDIEIITNNSDNFKIEIASVFNSEGVTIFDVGVKAKVKEVPKPITLKWKIPAHNIKGVWKPTSDFSKRIQADWEIENMESRISIDSPVISLFGHNDCNTHTFACSNAINKLELNARVREEDDCFYCHITLFAERYSKIKKFNIQLRIDSGRKHFSEALVGVTKWWETFKTLKPAYVPDIAKVPLYSTWYQFHQNLNAQELLDEFEIAHRLGYRAVIIDDGWQTKDDNRGYDYTGDWEPERLSNTKTFVEDIHRIGMKVGFWYSVPFCGKKSKVYKTFKGKFLTENHRWAPVLDPRYPEVRAYLINKYELALKEWNIDGFKLDFIDDFKLYPETKIEKSDDMDFHSINEAVDQLLSDVMKTLRKINPEVFIEFRQKYTGPAMRKYGNMFRAFDCPGDATMNRVRITDLRLLAGNTAVHSDMITWHNDEKLELATLQIMNTLFGVPQISVKLKDIPKDHLKMIKFYTKYWNKNKKLITSGFFIPSRPLANYPVQQVFQKEKLIIGVYDDHIVSIDAKYKNVDILNAKLSNSVIIKIESNIWNYRGKIFNCKGEVVNEQNFKLYKGLLEIEIPPCGLVQLKIKK